VIIADSPGQVRGDNLWCHGFEGVNLFEVQVFKEMPQVLADGVNVAVVQRSEAAEILATDVLEHTPAALEILLLLVNSVVLGVQEVKSVDRAPFGASAEFLTATAAAGQEAVALRTAPDPALTAAYIETFGNKVVAVWALALALIGGNVQSTLRGEAGVHLIPGEWVLLFD
jgi:hypothetical protein